MNMADDLSRMRQAGLDALFVESGANSFLAEDFQRKAKLDRFSAELAAYLPDTEAFLGAVSLPEAAPFVEFIAQDGKTKIAADTVDTSTAALGRAVDAGDLSIILREAEQFLNFSETRRAIEAGCEGRASVTAFLCGAGAASSELHYDAVDVFALTVAGRKDWVIYEPLLTRPSNLLKTLDADLWRDRARVARELTVGPGETLYVPRAVPHLVSNPHDTPCLHYTISIAHDSYEDLFRSMLRKALDETFLAGDWGFRIPKNADAGQKPEPAAMEKIMREVSDRMAGLMRMGQLSQHMQLSHHDLQTARRIERRRQENEGITRTDCLELAPDNGGLLTEWVVHLGLCIFVKGKSRKLHLPLPRWKWIVEERSFCVADYLAAFDEEAFADIEALARAGVVRRAGSAV